MHVKFRLLIGSVSVLLGSALVLTSSLFGESGTKHSLSSAPVSVAEASPITPVANVPATVPKVVSIVPADDAKDVLLDIEDPVIVSFDSSVKDFFVDFRFDPSIDVIYENNEDKTEFRILPKNQLKPSSRYVMNVFIKRRGMDDSAYTKIASTQFITKKELPAVSEREAMENRLMIARYDTVPQITEGRYIDVSLSKQVMVLFEDGQAVDVYPVSSGKRGMETPTGRYKIENKVKRAWSKTYGLYMPYWMALVPSGKFGIHELPEWPGGYKEGANHLGHPVSHGCVRLGVGSARRTWEWAEVGTPVIVH